MAIKRLRDFGAYLKRLREKRGIGTQRAVVGELGELGIIISQSLITKYENGDVGDPDPALLYALARVYGADYMEVVLKLTHEKYRLETCVDEVRRIAGKKYLAEDWPGTEALRELYDARWGVFDGALKRFDGIGGVSNKKDGLKLELLQLRAKAKLVDRDELLDVDGLAEWEQSLPDLERLWVAALRYVDNRNERMLDAVANNLKRGVIYTYFVPEAEMRFNGSFSKLRGQLAQKVPKAKVDLDRQLIAVPMAEKELRNLNVDYAIANPHLQPVGFQCVRHGDQSIPEYGFRVPLDDLAEVIVLLGDYAAAANTEGAAGLAKMLGVPGVPEKLKLVSNKN